MGLICFKEDLQVLFDDDPIQQYNQNKDDQKVISEFPQQDENDVKVSLNHFITLSSIYDRVMLVQHKTNIQLYAMKDVINKAAYTLKYKINIQTEQNVLEITKHNFITKLYYAKYTQTELFLIIKLFQEQNYLNIINEKAK
ncbi:unnamed protein product [Paramecium pentaurelia]|uniref:Uncharacterized protein n=1 Tax=Paramecium pentaurelia TaxID=43138 RepID=A0A8S1SZF6_9CILI|nr:unnamed protein product [Paramecium pentaurelia]